MALIKLTGGLTPADPADRRTFPVIYNTNLDELEADIAAAAGADPGTHNHDATYVGTAGAQTVAGVKTFSSSPIVPAPTSNLQAATKKYVDDNVVSGGVTVHNDLTGRAAADQHPQSAVTGLTSALAGKVGTAGNETVAGVKTFTVSPIVPAPTTNLQAATKKYVDDNVGIGASFPATGAITIIETATGAWSGDAPVRAVGVNPIEFRGWSDPAGQSGIATPARINTGDIWTVVSAP